MLDCQLVFVLEISRPNQPRFFHGYAQRFFTIDVQSPVHGPVSNERMGKVGCAANHSIQIFLIQTLAPINVMFCFGKFFSSITQMFFINITKGNNIFTFKPAIVRLCSTPGADQGNIKFIAGRILSGKNTTR